MRNKEYAFPGAPQINPVTGGSVTSTGMTLRDYFAAKAMQAYCQSGSQPMNTTASWAYQMADAMLKARES